MNIFVLSDLHMCNGGRLDTFKWNANDFIKKLEYVRETYSIDKVILNGDIYDLYKYPLKEITEKNAQIIHYFKSIHAIYIKGNHDISNPYGLRYYQIINKKGQRIRIEHGHKANFFNGTHAGRGICHSLFKLLKVCDHIPFAVRLYIGRLLKNEGLSRDRKYSFYTYLRYAVRLLQRNDVVILGHTHKLEVHTTYAGDKAKLYLNSGSCSFGRFQGMIFDTETLRYQLINKNTAFDLKPPRISGLVPHTIQHNTAPDYAAA